MEVLISRPHDNETQTVPTMMTATTSTMIIRDKTKQTPYQIPGKDGDGDDRLQIV